MKPFGWRCSNFHPPDSFGHCGRGHGQKDDYGWVFVTSLFWVVHNLETHNLEFCDWLNELINLSNAYD
jgi:hypothetical protein